MTMTEIEQLTPEEYSEFLVDGELCVEVHNEHVIDTLNEILVFDDCEQMIGVPYETN